MLLTLCGLASQKTHRGLGGLGLGGLVYKEAHSCFLYFTQTRLKRIDAGSTNCRWSSWFHLLITSTLFEKKILTAVPCTPKFSKLPKMAFKTHCAEVGNFFTQVTMHRDIDSRLLFQKWSKSVAKNPPGILTPLPEKKHFCAVRWNPLVDFLQIFTWYPTFVTHLYSEFRPNQFRSGELWP